MSLSKIPPFALLHFLTFPEAVALAETSHETAIIFATPKAVRIVRDRLTKVLGKPTIELMMGGGFAVAGYSAREFVLGEESPCCLELYFSMNYPPLVFVGTTISGRVSIREHIRIRYGIDTRKADRRGGVFPSLHAEISSNFSLLSNTTLSFLVTANGAKMVIEVDSRDIFE